MKNIFFFLTISLSVFSCNSDDDSAEVVQDGVAKVEIEFDNIITQDGFERQLRLRDATDSITMDYTNQLGQPFNIATLKYYISNIQLMGEQPYSLHMNATPTSSEGYWLVKESAGFNLFSLDEVPIGTYTGISFSVGIDAETIEEGVQGGVLDPVEERLFWNWNSGYIFTLFEGFSTVSKGNTAGRVIPKSSKGIAYHVGGWRIIPDNPKMINNVKNITLNFDQPIDLQAGAKPHLHLTFDVYKWLGDIDFSVTSSAHSPSSGKIFADNYSAAFAFDHIHK